MDKKVPTIIFEKKILALGVLTSKKKFKEKTVFAEFYLNPHDGSNLRMDSIVASKPLSLKYLNNNEPYEWGKNWVFTGETTKGHLFVELDHVSSINLGGINLTDKSVKVKSALISNF